LCLPSLAHNGLLYFCVFKLNFRRAYSCMIHLGLWFSEYHFKGILHKCFAWAFALYSEPKNLHSPKVYLVKALLPCSLLVSAGGLHRMFLFFFSWKWKAIFRHLGFYARVSVLTQVLIPYPQGHLAQTPLLGFTWPLLLPQPAFSLFSYHSDFQQLISELKLGFFPPRHSVFYPFGEICIITMLLYFGSHQIPYRARIVGPFLKFVGENIGWELETHVAHSREMMYIFLMILIIWAQHLDLVMFCLLRAANEVNRCQPTCRIQSSWWRASLSGIH
jgi:hypothetical protein